MTEWPVLVLMLFVSLVLIFSILAIGREDARQLAARAIAHVRSGLKKRGRFDNLK